MNLPGRHRPAAEKIKADYDKVVREYYLEDGKALISCKVRGMDDIISHYSVKNRENMNPELSAYLDDNIFYVPLEHPVIIRFCGCEFTKDEQEIIRRTILLDYEFKLGLAKQNLKRNYLYSAVTLCLGILFLFLYSRLANSGPVGSLLTVFFWFFLFEFGGSWWSKGIALRDEVKHAQRIMNAEIQFESYLGYRKIKEAANKDE
ncbi:MAG: hypothetical protein K6D92_01405 [Erysipelotrichaceae bacterium]|nr:hypothetical protein [Erysipelotrichaceae bacterium]